MAKEICLACGKPIFSDEDRSPIGKDTFMHNSCKEEYEKDMKAFFGTPEDVA